MKKILIVDDSAILRNIIRSTLENSGFNVIAEASNAEEAIDMFDKEKPDLVLLDILLPGESGIDILKKLVSQNPAVKVLMVTAVNQDAVNKEVKELGAKGILYKPFDPSDLISAVNSMLK